MQSACEMRQSLRLLADFQSYGIRKAVSYICIDPGTHNTTSKAQEIHRKVTQSLRGNVEKNAWTLIPIKTKPSSTFESQQKVVLLTLSTN